MENVNKLKKDLDSFRDTVSALSSAINRCGITWQDEQFSGLSSLIGHLAAQSKNVMDASSRSIEAIHRFERVEKM